MKNFALELKNISHKFDLLEAISDLSISVEPGEVVCLLGPSGCGKSTTLRLAAGLDRLQSGEIYLNGELISNINTQIPPEERSVGLVFQDYALFPHLSVLGNVKFGLNHLSKAESKRRAVEALKMVDMETFSDSFPHTLSGGQQQRVALARALAPGPNVMLLDEPYSGLDARLRDSIRDQVLHLLKANNCATLMVTHDSEEAMFMADRIVVMRDGKVVQTGTPEELYCHPVNSFVASIFGELNFVNGKVTENGIISDLGTLPSNGIAVGKSVEIAVRPEALTIVDETEKKNRPRAMVIESRLLGRTSFIHLSFPYPKKAEEKSKHLHARIPGVSLPKPGDIVEVEIDLTQTFIFETNKGT